MPSILIIEDEEIIRNSIRRLLDRNGYDTAACPSLESAIEKYRPSDFDLILSDLRLPGAPGIDIIPHAGETPVIIITSYASVPSAVDAMKRGAVDYIAKPFDHDELLHAVNRVLEEARLRRQNAALKADLGRSYPTGAMIGKSPAMQQVFNMIRKVAPTDTTVLILGESGTGKELVARAVHEQSRRANGPLVAVNCAAIPQGLIEAELFGHERGAFTGAVGARPGLIEAADGGTLFLDELGELPLPAQAQLLRVLQEGEIRRIGASTSRKVNIRLVAATHRDLAKMVKEGKFREDLYFRIHVMEIRMPPLRERGDDLIELAHYALEKACRRLHRPPMRLSEDALAALRAYSWPGNVRELENVMERAAILNDGDVVTAELLGLPPAEASRPPAPETTTPDLSLEEYFREFVLQHQDKLTETELARRLGISRKTLWERRQRLNLPRPSR
ncbi:MAG: sigma-54-dependent Fis family transcriptional regulator [Xanthomonadaceae bacterium]|nr:sigma-54-dependent Fis family transcriptional regulator [Xanthomonadaceae bacterium]